MDARVAPGHDERRNSGRIAKAPEADWQGAENTARMTGKEQPAAVQAPGAGLFWFAMTGISNGLSALTLFAAVRNGPITLVAPLAAIYPLITVGLSAMALKHIAITARIVIGTALTVLGVALVLIG
jgi:uncharacterized membrane protein